MVRVDRYDLQQCLKSPRAIILMQIAVAALTIVLWALEPRGGFLTALRYATPWMLAATIVLLVCGVHGAGISPAKSLLLIVLALWMVLAFAVGTYLLLA